MDWTKPLFFRSSKFGSNSLQKTIAMANKNLLKCQKLLDRIESYEQISRINAKSIPSNATIRREYIKCGKGCENDPHGPYYYAYWKQKMDDGSKRKKLYKKYIGTYLPLRGNR